MKSIICVFVFWGFLSNCSYGYKTNENEKQKLEMLKEFYTIYIKQVADGPAGESGEQAINAIRKKYCSSRLLKELKKKFENGQLDYDPFLKAQDSDTSLLKTLSITKDEHKENVYEVSYSYDRLSGNRSEMIKETVIIHLTLIKANNQYKIDSVW